MNYFDINAGRLFSYNLALSTVSLHQASLFIDGKQDIMVKDAAQGVKLNNAAGLYGK